MKCQIIWLYIIVRNQAWHKWIKLYLVWTWNTLQLHREIKFRWKWTHTAAASHTFKAVQELCLQFWVHDIFTLVVKKYHEGPFDQSPSRPLLVPCMLHLSHLLVSTWVTSEKLHPHVCYCLLRLLAALHLLVEDFGLLFSNQ